MAWKRRGRLVGPPPHPGRPTAALGLLGWVAVVPLLLIALGIWQDQRAADDVATFTRLEAALPASLARLEQLAAQQPYASVRLAGLPGFYGASLAVSMIKERVPGVRRDRLVSQVRLRVAQGTFAGAMLAAAAGLVGLLATSLAGLWARLSRDRLVASFSLMRRGLPVLLGAQIVGLALAVVCAALFEAGGLWFADQLSANLAKLVGAGLLLAGVAVIGAATALGGLRRVFALFTPAPLEVWGRAIDKAQAPRLWNVITDIAARQEALAPDAIVLGLGESFFVTEAVVRIWPEDRLLPGRTLHLPAPYLGLLHAREFAAIIGHELAHFAGADTAYSRRVIPIHAGLQRALVALRQAQMGLPLLQPAVRLSFHAVHTFDAAVARWSRAREFEADRRGSHVGGPEAAATALVRVSAIQPVVAATLGHLFATPDDSAVDVVAAVVAAVEADGLPDAARHLEDHQPHPTDSHPPSRQRIAALGIACDAALLARSTRAASREDRALPGQLFKDWPGLCRELSDDLIAEACRRRDKARARLEEAAAAMPAGETALYENGRPMVWTMAVVAVGFTVFGATLLIVQPSSFVHDDLAQKLIAAIVACGIVGPLGFAAIVHRRGRHAFLVLDARGLHSPFLAAVVLWEHIDGVSVVMGRRLRIVVALAASAPLPSVARRLSRHATVSRRRRCLTVSLLGVRGTKPNALAAMLTRYYIAHRAGTLLRQE